MFLAPALTAPPTGEKGELADLQTERLLQWILKFKVLKFINIQYKKRKKYNFNVNIFFQCILYEKRENDAFTVGVTV